MGKTTFCSALEELGFEAHFEIGRKLRKRVDFSFSDKVEWFDQQVLNEEVKRDAQLSSYSRPLAVETWHIGNIAFALERSPEVAARYKQLLPEALARFNPRAVLVDVDDLTFEDRASDPVDSVEGTEGRRKFYVRVNMNLRSLVSEFEIPCIEISGTDEVSDNLKKVKAWLQ